MGNLTDGRVLVVAEGDQVELDVFIRAIGDQMAGYISGHTVVRCTATGGAGSGPLGFFFLTFFFFPFLGFIFFPFLGFFFFPPLRFLCSVFELNKSIIL